MNVIPLFIAVLICIPAFLLAAQKSSWLIDYLIAVVAFNRGLRRIVDYMYGAFDPFSPISLTPLIVSGLAALVIIFDFSSGSRAIGNISRRTLSWYLIAVSIAFVVGLYNNRLGAVYDLGNYLAPVGMLGFGVLYSEDPKVMRRWGVSAALVGVGVAVYGIYQFYTIPAWDAFWVIKTGGVGYFGSLKPTKMTLFSTMAERGPAAAFLAATLILILLRPSLLGIFRFPFAAIVSYAMVLTYSRTVVIQVALACVALPIVTKGRGLAMLAVLTVFLIFCGESLLSFMPNAAKVTSRLKTMQNLHEDSSMKGRLMIFSLSLKKAAMEPLGLGLGSHGIGNRVTGTKRSGSMDSTGYLEILRTFGWVGFAYVFAVLWQLWASSTFVWKNDAEDSDVKLFRAWFISGMIALFAGNWLAAASYFWLLGGYVLGRHDIIAMRNTSRPKANYTTIMKPIELVSHST